MAQNTQGSEKACEIQYRWMHSPCGRRNGLFPLIKGVSKWE